MARRIKKIARRKTRPTTGQRAAPAKRTARKKVTRRAGASPGNSRQREAPHSGYQLSDDDVERFLLTGEYQGVLEDYFGEQQYRDLAALKKQASRRSVRGGPRVLILPGIMGSTLGKERKILWDDVVWIDPLDIARGKLESLALGRDKAIVALGVILFTYLKLKLRLRIAGFDADFYPFDWRRSLDELGAELVEHLRTEHASEVHLVAHSMGGLVARAAIAQDGRKVGRLVMLGTPNFGSFVPVQAIRATYPAVLAVAKLDLKNSPVELSEKVFKTLPGLHQMLPSPKRYSKVDLYDRSNWPTDAPVPLQSILSRCVAVQEKLADADHRFHLIAGVNQETATDLTIADGKLEYELSTAGDGTVPLDFCELPGARTWYVEESHGSLPNHRAVGQAVIDILSTGDTRALGREWDRRAVRRRRTVREADVTVDPFPGLSGKELGPRERRSLLAGLASPDSRDEPSGPAPLPRTVEGPTPGYQHSFRNVRVDHTDRHAIVLCFAKGDVTEVQSKALVLGLFRGVEPAGAAAAVDERVDGAVKEFMTRRMFNGEVGEIFPLPTGRHLIYAENVLFAGLGDYGTFGPDVQQLVAENVLRTCVRAGIEDFASVLIGTGSGESAESTVYNQLCGYIRGLEDADHGHRIRRITLCERDPDVFLRMKEEVLRLATTGLFGNVEVLFDEVALPAPAVVPVSARRATLVQVPELTYLYVTEEERSGRKAVYRSSVLSAGSKAAVLTGRQEVSLDALNDHLAKIESTSFDADSLADFGSRLAELVLEPSIAKGLRELHVKDGSSGDGDRARRRSAAKRLREIDVTGGHLVVVHDAPTSLVPWETICIDGWFPAAGSGLSRRYAAEDLSVAKWLERRRLADTLEVLLVVNPTEDLPGAEREAERIKESFPQGNSRLRLTEVRGGAATRHRLLVEFKSGKYDVIHYAGHAFFDPVKRSRSGILCAGEQVLSGADLAGVANLPALLFFNACESGRVRRTRAEKKKADLAVPKRIERNVGLAEAFMRGGAANYLGTYWPVGDAAAATFAPILYNGLLEGKPIGEAIQAGRKEVKRAREVDWADYIHYGSYDFQLKIPNGG